MEVTDVLDLVSRNTDPEIIATNLLKLDADGQTKVYAAVREAGGESAVTTLRNFATVAYFTQFHLH